MTTTGQNLPRHSQPDMPVKSAAKSDEIDPNALARTVYTCPHCHAGNDVTEFLQKIREQGQREAHEATISFIRHQSSNYGATGNPQIAHALNKVAALIETAVLE